MESLFTREKEGVDIGSFVLILKKKKKKKQLVHLRLFWSLWKKQNHKILKQIRVAEVEAERCTSQIIYIFFFF